MTQTIDTLQTDTHRWTGRLANSNISTKTFNLWGYNNRNITTVKAFHSNDTWDITISCPFPQNSKLIM